MQLETPRQSLERAREVANLVALHRPLESAAQTAAIIGDFARLFQKLSQRLHDRRADEQREEKCDDDRGEKNLQDRESNGVDILADVVGRLRDEHRTLHISAVINRQRGVQRHMTRRRRRDAFLDAGLSDERSLQLGAIENGRAFVCFAGSERTRRKLRTADVGEAAGAEIMGRVLP